MTSQRLREAASLLRERAGAATPGPWFADDDLWVIPESMDSGVGGNNLAYIATMSPPVARKLADLMDLLSRRSISNDLEHVERKAAVAVADAILGDA